MKPIWIIEYRRLNSGPEWIALPSRWYETKKSCLAIIVDHEEVFSRYEYRAAKYTRAA